MPAHHMNLDSPPMKLFMKKLTEASFALWVMAFICSWVFWHIILSWGAGEIGTCTMIVPHDGWLPFNNHASLRYLSFFDSTNGGIEAPLVPAIHYLTVIIWYVFSKTLSLNTSINAAQIQLLIMSFSMATTTLCSYHGFRKIAYHLFGEIGIHPRSEQNRDVISLVVTVFYIISPPVLVYMSYGVIWSPSIALSVGLLPLSIGLFMALLESPPTSAMARDQIALGATVGLITLALLLFFPLLIVLAALTVSYFSKFKANWQRFLVPAFIAILISLPTLYAIFCSLAPGTEFVPDYVTKNAAYGNIKGGFLTPLLERSAWILYNVWEPRIILNFYEHFYSLPFTATVLAVLFLVIYLAISKKLGKLLSGVFLFLIVSLFLIKGSNPPFGQLFEVLLDNIPIFLLIRTPDTKLSIIVHLAFALILLWGLLTAAKKIRYIIFAVAIAFAAINLTPIINGSAPFGIAPQSGKGYLIELSEAERKIEQILSAAPSWTRILTTSPGGNSLRSTGFFGYAEPLKFAVPSIFLQTGIEEVSSLEITGYLNDFKNGSLNALDKLEVNYIIVRKDRLSRGGSSEYINQIAELKSRYIPVVESDDIVMFRYSLPPELPMRIIGGQYSHFDVSLQSMSLYSLMLEKSTGASVKLLLNNTSNKYWRLISVGQEECKFMTPYVCAIYKILLRNADVYKPVRPDTANTDAHVIWELPSDINLVGKTLVIVFERQLLMVVFIALSVITLITSLAFALRYTFLRNKDA